MAKEVILTTIEPGGCHRNEACSLVEEDEPGHDDIDGMVAFRTLTKQFWVATHNIVRIELV